MMLTLILRLRQLCCHPYMITSMLDKEDVQLSGIDQEEECINAEIIEAVNKILGEEELEELDDSDSDDDVPEDDSFAKNVMSRSNPVFDEERESSKVKK